MAGADTHFAGVSNIVIDALRVPRRAFIWFSLLVEGEDGIFKFGILVSKQAKKQFIFVASDQT